MLVHCQFDFFALPMIELCDIFSLDSPAKQQVLFVKQPFNLSSLHAIFGPAIFYGSRSDSLKADLHGTTLPHTTSLQQACDMS